MCCEIKRQGLRGHCEGNPKVWVSRSRVGSGVQNCPGRWQREEDVLGTDSMAGGGKPCDGTSPAGFYRVILSSHHTVRCCVCV